MTTSQDQIWSVPSTAELRAELALIDIEGLVAQYGAPLLVLRPERVREQYQTLVRLLPGVIPHYAIKALAHPAALVAIAEKDGYFDVASLQEVSWLHEHGVDPAHCIYTHPIKKPSEVAAAVQYGIRLFVFDNASELDKFRGYEASIELLLRLRYTNTAALIDLSYKFGAAPAEALALLRLARLQGLKVRGLAFHPGSQLATVEPVVEYIGRSADLIDEAATAGFSLDVLDIGGGLPVPYDKAVPHLNSFAPAINAAIEPLLASGVKVISEPGRFVAAPAMLSITSVVGLSYRDGASWYYLDDGLYGSFSNVLSDHVNPVFFAYKDLMGADNGPQHLAVLAGPTCDSTDVISTMAPLTRLGVGDLLVTPFMGAYTPVTACGFNGIPKTRIIVV